MASDQNPNGEAVPFQDAYASEHGFSRAEMFQSKLVGTVKEYDTHLFVCVDSPSDTWPKGKIDDLSEAFNVALKSKKQDIPRNIKLTVAEAGSYENSKSGDVLLFPDMKCYSNIAVEDVPKFVDEVLIGTSNTSFTEHPLNGIQLFVCCHSLHDTRCGVCGPPLVHEFRLAAKALHLENFVSVWPCSHIGGHKYAGNVIIYNQRPDGTVSGDWYGYVTPKDVPTLLNAAMEGKIIDSLWRGGLGLSPEAQEREQALRFQGCGANCACIEEKTAELQRPKSPAAAKAEAATTADGSIKSSKAASCSSSRSISFSWSNTTSLTAAAVAVAVGAVAVTWYIRSHRSS